MPKPCTRRSQARAAVPSPEHRRESRAAQTGGLLRLHHQPSPLPPGRRPVGRPAHDVESPTSTTPSALFSEQRPVDHPRPDADPQACTTPQTAGTQHGAVGNTPPKKASLPVVQRVADWHAEAEVVNPVPVSAMDSLDSCGGRLARCLRGGRSGMARHHRHDMALLARLRRHRGCGQRSSAVDSEPDQEESSSASRLNKPSPSHPDPLAAPGRRPVVPAQRGQPSWRAAPPGGWSAAEAASPGRRPGRSASAANGASPNLRSRLGERDAQRPASAPAERERNTRAQRGCSLAHRAAMWYPLRG
ncbi:hypothetical protein RKD18_008185, partial [Streptomyces phaeoluteigriseus]